MILINFKLKNTNMDNLSSDSENASEEYRINLSSEELSFLKLQGFCEDEFKKAKAVLKNSDTLQSMRFYLKFATKKTHKVAQ